MYKEYRFSCTDLPRRKKIGLFKGADFILNHTFDPPISLKQNDTIKITFTLSQ